MLLFTVTPCLELNIYTQQPSWDAREVASTSHLQTHLYNDPGLIWGVFPRNIFTTAFQAISIAKKKFA